MYPVETSIRIEGRGSIFPIPFIYLILYFFSFKCHLARLENSFESEGSTIMIHLSNSFRYFLSFHPRVILREWVENLKEFEG